MRKANVLAYFESKLVTQKALAGMLNISQPAISKWPEVVPELQAIKIARLTNNKLTYDESAYRNGKAA